MREKSERQFLACNSIIYWINELYQSEGDTELEIKPARISPILVLFWVFISWGKIAMNLIIIAQGNPQNIMACLVFDVRKVSNVPSCKNGLFYYTDKLALYNLTITNFVSKDVFFIRRTKRRPSEGQWYWQLLISSCELVFKR